MEFEESGGVFEVATLALGAVEQGGFDDELGLGWVGGLVFVEEAATMRPGWRKLLGWRGRSVREWRERRGRVMRPNST
jgi:hypothetical protein